MVLFHCPVLWAAKCQILSGCLKQLSATVMESCLLNQWRSHHLVNGGWGAVHLILKLKFKMSQMSFPLKVTPSFLSELNQCCYFKALCENNQGGKCFVRLECSDDGGHYQHLVRIQIKTSDDYEVIHEGRSIISNPHLLINPAFSTLTVASANHRVLFQNDRGTNWPSHGG